MANSNHRELPDGGGHNFNGLSTDFFHTVLAQNALYALRKGLDSVRLW